jgi:hypothetical protein
MARRVIVSIYRSANEVTPKLFSWASTAYQDPESTLQRPRSGFYHINKSNKHSTRIDGKFVVNHADETESSTLHIILLWGTGCCPFHSVGPLLGSK